MDYYDNRGPFSEITNNIEVIVVSKFYPDGSNIENNKFFWFYSIQIQNLGNSSIKLIEREWWIYDANGILITVKGDGVVGQQPIIEPNEYFEYISQVQLFTDNGLMYGNYKAKEINSEELLLIKVPAFSLDSYKNLLLIN